MSVPGPVQPVPLLQVQQDQQVDQKSDIANVEDAVEDAVEPSGEDRKVAEAAAALERITVEEPAKVKRGSAGKTIKTTLNYIRSVELRSPLFSLSQNSQLLSAGWSEWGRRRTTSTR